MSTPHDSEAKPVEAIPTLPEDATPEQKDEHWFKYVYQGDRMPQLTVRAVVIGGFLGMAMAAANLYTTLQIGWAFGIAITSCVLSFVMWNLVRLMSGNRVGQMSILENACMASTASAAGYSTGSTIATMFGALVLMADIPEGKTTKDMYTWDISAPWLVATFTLCTGLMGVFLAIPMKRQQINHEQLPFPSGIAAAETLKSLYSASREAVLKAYVLVIGLGLGLVIGFLRVGDSILDAVGFLKRVITSISFLRIPEHIDIPLIGRLYPTYTNVDGSVSRFFPAGFSFEPSALLIAAGMIVGLRISTSLVVSSLILYVVVGPQLAKVDDGQLGGPAKTVLVEVRRAAATAPDTAGALAAAGVAAEKAATAAGLDGVAIAKAAVGAGQDEIDSANKKLSELKAKLEKAGEQNAVVSRAPEDEAKLRKVVIDAAAGTAAGRSGTAFANLPATRASKEARDAAKARGATDEEANAAATAAFEAKKYKPAFIWDWAGGQVMLTRWALWGGTSVMVFSSLMAVALQWRTIIRAFRGVKVGAGGNAAHAEIEVPGLWMVVGMIPISIAMVWLQIQAFGVSWYAGIIAVAMSFVLSLVASRATGETDTTPIGAMGKVMQLLFAVLAPKNLMANLGSAGIAANSAIASADLLTDLKTGYLLGANPRKQFWAQFFGVFFGTLAIVPIWFLMVPTRAKLEEFSLPSTRAWEAVARVLVKGVGELPPSSVYAILVGATVGMALPIIEKLLPAKARKYMPSAMGIGLAWVMPFQNAFSFFVGAVIAWFWAKLSKRTAEHYNIPLASGLIAGESLMAAALAISATVVGLLSR